MSFRTTLAGAAVAAAFVASSTNAQVISRFELSDHPDGNQNPPPYGLRLDGLFGGGVTTFSFDPFNVILTVTDSTGIGGGITIDINGRVFGGEVDGNGGWSDPQTYRIDFSYTTNVVAQDGGWKVAGVDNTGNTGTLSLAPTRANSTDLFTITDNDNNAFLFLPDGHRLSGDNSTWAGRGWLTENTNGNNTGDTQDWLFLGTPTTIPTPASALLTIAGIGLVSAGRRR